MRRACPRPQISDGSTRVDRSIERVNRAGAVGRSMALSVHQMLAFSDDLNERWFPWLREQPTEVLAHNYEFSFRSPLGILTHMGNVEHTWLGLLEGQQPDWRKPPHSTKAFDEVGPVLSFLEETRARTHKLVDSLDEEALQQQHALEDASWLQKDALTTEELLWIIFTHEQWHRGELLAAFWSRDIEPPRLDWHQYASPIGGLLAR